MNTFLSVFILLWYLYPDNVFTKIVKHLTMLMKIVEVIVEHAGKNLSAYIEGAPIITVGNDMREIEDNMNDAIELYLEDNPNPVEILSGEFELKFKIDTVK